MSFRSNGGPQAREAKTQHGGESTAKPTSHFSEITAATGMLPDIVNVICLLNCDETAPELTHLSIHDIARLLQNWDRWYSKSQFSKLIHIQDAIAHLKACICDINPTQLDEKEEGRVQAQEGEASILHEEFMQLYQQYIALLPFDESGNLVAGFVTEQKLKLTDYIDFANLYDDLSCANLSFALTHLLSCRDALDVSLLSGMLVVAAREGHQKFFRILLSTATDSDARIAMVKHERYRALAYAAGRGHTEIVTAIFDTLPSSEARLEALSTHNCLSSTILMGAAKRGHTETALALLKAAPNDMERIRLLTTKDKPGHDAISIARARHPETAKALQNILCELEAQSHTATSRGAPAAALFGSVRQRPVAREERAVSETAPSPEPAPTPPGWRAG